MHKVAEQLQTVPNIGYILYADKETALQEAAQIMEGFASKSGLHSALQKSQVIQVHNPRYKSPIPINLSIEGQAIMYVELLRILGLWIQSSLNATHIIRTLKTTAAQIIRMISRITKNRQGMPVE